MNSAAAPGSIGGAVVDLEVIIVGDGLAASAAAIVLAKQNIAFAIIAPRTKIQPTYRIGESLGAGAQDVLRSLGVWEKFLLGPHRPSSQFFTAWGAPLLQRRPEQPGWTLDRLTFDQMMKDAANASEPPRLDAAVRLVVREAGRWRVTTGVGEVLTCRFIIDGSGRAAAVARRLTTPRRYDRLVACHSLVDQTVTEVQPTPATLVESADKGWWYSTLLPSGKALVAWFTDSCPGSIIRDSDAWRTRLATSRFAVPWLESAGFQEAALPMISAAGTVVLASAADASLADYLRVPRRWNGLLRRTSTARAIQGSNTIEGYTVSEEDAVAADRAPIPASDAAFGSCTSNCYGCTWSLACAYPAHKL